MKPEMPCDFDSITDRAERGCDVVEPMCNRTALGTLKDDDYICYGFVPYRDQDLQAIEDFEEVEDANDPKFYSTCWIKLSSGGFINLPPEPAKVPPKWDAGPDRCVTCTFRDNVFKSNISMAPLWARGLTQQCVDCDNPDTLK
eukprot:Colp12_sorted_trinity150504_noHs@35575